MSARKTPIRPHQMNAAQRALYGKIAHGTRAANSAFPLVDETGGLTGPFDAMLLAPAIGEALQALGSTLRFNGQLTHRAREIAILLVAHHRSSPFEIAAHEAVGRQVGLSTTDLTELAAGEAPSSADGYERSIAELVTCLLGGGGLDDQSYQTAVQQLGEPLLFEIVVLVGYYSLLAVQLSVFVD